MMYYCVYQYIALKLQYQTLAKINFEQGDHTSFMNTIP